MSQLRLPEVVSRGQIKVILWEVDFENVDRKKVCESCFLTIKEYIRVHFRV